MPHQERIKHPDLRDIEHRLEVCPWCKKKPRIERDFSAAWVAACRNSACPTKPITLGFDNPEQALLTWNCREQVDIMPAPTPEK